ncbi:hypothetical protein B5807_02124 [Epicoccum nigrum]|uniref:Uncharacterized protein n=1 Tax=Epicoccum nigrum TaxID=105696 RepID=A0A1Y2MB19_EPING|nr:hypothetical protein B5807_02124 [Epicoccum nigrum]
MPRLSLLVSGYPDLRARARASAGPPSHSWRYLEAQTATERSDDFGPLTLAWA